MTIFYIATCSTLCMLIWLVIEHLLGSSETSGSSFRLFTLEPNPQIIGCIVVGFCNMVGLACKTIAYQNERPGFITLVGYIGLVYAFLCDTFFLKKPIGGL